MKITDFKIGDAIKRFGMMTWFKIEKHGFRALGDDELIHLSFNNLCADDWEYYQETKKEKKKETWYQVLYQFNETETPCLDDDLWKCLEDYYQITDTDLKDYKFEPKLINPVEVEYE